MTLKYPKNIVTNPLAALRQAGYAYFVDPNTNHGSYELRLTGARFPRYHLYVEDRGENWDFNLHIDQKQPSYGDNHMHSGEYDGPVVETEAKRIHGWVVAWVKSQTAE